MIWACNVLIWVCSDKSNNTFCQYVLIYTSLAPPCNSRAMIVVNLVKQTQKFRADLEPLCLLWVCIQSGIGCCLLLLVPSKFAADSRLPPDPSERLRASCDGPDWKCWLAKRCMLPEVEPFWNLKVDQNISKAIIDERSWARRGDVHDGWSSCIVLLTCRPIVWSQHVQ